MAENKNQKSKSEEDFEGIKFADFFSNLLNIAAFGIIITIMFLLFSNPYSNNKGIKEVTNEIKIKYVPTGNRKIDVENFNSLIDEKFKEYKDQLKDSEKERNESMKYYGTLVSFILAIVGFFGFKSVHDTRQMALESVKVKAEEAAKKITLEKIQGYVNENVKNEINEYFDSSGKKDVEEIVGNIAYEEANKIAKSTALEEFNRLKADLNESRLAFKDDLEFIERDRKRLLKRIQDLEKKIYGDPTSEDDEGEGEGDDSDKVVPIV